MTTDQHHGAQQPAGGHPHGRAVSLLEMLDNWAHIVVAAFFILMAATVIVHMGFIFLRQIPLIVPAAATDANTPVPQTATRERKPTAPRAFEPAPETTRPSGEPSGPLTASKTTPLSENPENASSDATAPMRETSRETSAAAMEQTHAQAAADPFVKNSLELLSNILFVVILLELLRTIITYLETHDIQAIMQEFLVVGIISSVRKILLVGAEASLVGSKGMEFIQEAGGVVINIIGILLLILGLVMLKRAFGTKVQKEMQDT